MDRRNSWISLVGLGCLLASVAFPLPLDGAEGRRRVPSSAGSLSQPVLAPDYPGRRQAYLAAHQNADGGIHVQLARLHLGLPADEKQILASLERMDARRDCADFDLAGMLRLLYQFRDSPLLGKQVLHAVQRSVIQFKYWPDEPGEDHMCTWSENHHILFSSAEYLAGQLYPARVFSNSRHTGRQKMQRGKQRVLRWLDLRYKTGFSEWLSHIYYVEDVAALVNLIDFAEDEEISKKATMVLDLLLLDMALNHFRGTFASTHGRSYFPEKTDGRLDHTASIYGLLFGLNAPRPGNMAAVALAISPRYRVPAVLADIAKAAPDELENRQRMGIRLEEAERWGLDFKRLDDGMTLLSLEAYSHPKTIELFMRMMDEYRWWKNRFFAPFEQQRMLTEPLGHLGLLPVLAWVFERDLTRNMRPEVNIYTYRTPDYMLSSAQDYRAGYGGDQQHIWSAALGERALVFTTHPVEGREETPNQWSGSGSLPRVAQLKNVAIAVYDIWTWPGLYVTHRDLYTHAWFPKAEFDATHQRGGWLFGRKGDGYLALWSLRPWHWQTHGPWKDREIVAPGTQNIWICELGRKSKDGTFEQFVERIATAELKTDALQVRYHSPSQGVLEFGWNGPCRQNDAMVPLGDYDRYRNPYVTAGFPGQRIEVRLNGNWMILDYESLSRTASGFLAQTGARVQR